MEITRKSLLDPIVASAFNIDPEISLLPGGIDLKTFRSGSVVLRNLGEESEDIANWTANLFDSIREDGFRVAKPIRANDGSWMVNGWVAERFLEGKHATKDDLPAVIESVNRFHAAIVNATPPNLESREPSMYAKADQWAWGEIPNDIDPELYKLASEIAVLRKPVDLPNQLIHGDLNLNNVLIADNLPPAIIDLAPYYRPAEFAQAVAAYWVGPYEGDLKVLHNFRNIKEFNQMLIRAGLRMMLIQKDLLHASGLERYRNANNLIKQFVTS